MWKIVLFILLNIFCYAFAHLELSEEQYYQLPRLFHLDDYDECLSQKHSVYCMGSFHLSPERGHSLLYEQIEEYTKGPFNFNHTNFHRGVCISRRCIDFNNSLSPEEKFQKCVEKYSLNRYGLSARLISLDYCKTHETWEKPISSPEKRFLYAITLILILNLFGTVHDVFKKDEKGNPYLMAWSLKQNCKKLFSDDKTEPVLQPMYFIRVFGSILVILGHVLFGLTRSYLNNPRHYEQVSENPMTMICHNGSAIVQIFSMCANMLLAHGLLKEADKNPRTPFGFSALPKIVINRLIRLLPSYWLVVGYAATLWPHFAKGPLWYPIVEAESLACRKLWLTQVLLLGNHVMESEHGRCLGNTWSLASDFQLYVVSAALCLVLIRSRRPVAVLVTLFFTSLFLLFVVSYKYSLYAMIMYTNPEIMRAQYQGMPAITAMYVSPWASAPSAILGLILAFYLYDMEKKDAAKHKKDLNEPKKYSLIFTTLLRSSVFLVFAWLILGNWVRNSGSPLILALHATLDRPVFSLGFVGIIIGSITKIDPFWSWLTSRNFWKIPGRLSLWVLFLHWFVAMTMFGSRPLLNHVSIFNIIVDWTTVTIVSYILAIPFTVMVEMPAQTFLKKLLFF